jgi:hypothetical protein
MRFARPFLPGLAPIDDATEPSSAVTPRRATSSMPVKGRNWPKYRPTIASSESAATARSVRQPGTQCGGSAFEPGPLETGPPGML